MATTKINNIEKQNTRRFKGYSIATGYDSIDITGRGKTQNEAVNDLIDKTHRFLKNGGEPHISHIGDFYGMVWYDLVCMAWTYRIGNFLEEIISKSSCAMADWDREECIKVMEDHLKDIQ